MNSQSRKDLAIALRNKGLSYSEILTKIPVAKSTLSLWLRHVALATKQQQRLSKKKINGALRGAKTRKVQKENKIRELKRLGKQQLGLLTKREKWLIGVALFWAEGSKEKEYAPGSNLVFNNSDPKMIRYYIYWLTACCEVLKESIVLTLYIHKHKEKEIKNIQDYWTDYLDFPRDYIRGVYYKKSTPKTNRKNINNLYYGTMRVTVSRSSNLSRTVAGLFEGIADSV